MYFVSHQNITVLLHLTMNAHALLTSQGWRGTGNSLHPTSNTIGLSKPLLVSRKDNNNGVGRKQHKTSDMWWMNAFDKSLKGLDTSEEGKVVSRTAAGGLEMVVKGGAKWVGNGGGLYASFVRGEGLGGTIEERQVYMEASTLMGEEVLGKRKRESEGECKEERRARKEAKRTARTQASSSESTPDPERIKERKEERKVRKAAEKARKTQDAAVEKEMDEMKVDETTESAETKEARKARRVVEKCRKGKETPVREETDSMEIFSTREKLEKTERRDRKRHKKLRNDAKQDTKQDTKEEKCSSKTQKKRRRKN
jgi:nucleolar protein TMA23